MATIVVEVDDALMEAAARRAESEHTTLEAVVARFVAEYAAGAAVPSEDPMAVIRRMQSYVNTGNGPFNREELNER
ncbi:MAG: hypothetical protein IT438_16530 [Phycisphaerales bacterium]|nr:hypothetical protein [Phycisphaerales bacterium]